MMEANYLFEIVVKKRTKNSGHSKWFRFALMSPADSEQ